MDGWVDDAWMGEWVDDGWINGRVMGWRYGWKGDLMCGWVVG